MAFLDHEDHDSHCIWCGDRWPCDTGLMRRELADYLRAMPVAPNDENGVDFVADLIDC